MTAGVGTAASKSEAETVRKDLESITSRTLGETYTIDDSLLQYDSGWMLRQDIEDKAVYEDQLSDEIGLVTSAYCCMSTMCASAPLPTRRVGGTVGPAAEGGLR